MLNRRVQWTDDDGCWYISLLPNYEPDSNARMGLLLGPPDLRPLELPDDIRVRLNHELVHREILTTQDASNRRADVLAAIRSALRIDTERLLNLCFSPIAPAVELPPLERYTDEGPTWSPPPPPPPVRKRKTPSEPTTPAPVRRTRKAAS